MVRRRSDGLRRAPFSIDWRAVTSLTESILSSRKCASVSRPPPTVRASKGNIMSASQAAVLVPGKIHNRVLERLKDRVELITVERSDALDAETAARIRGVAVSGSFSGAAMDRLPNLEIIASFGVGYDNIDVGHAASRKIIVT